MRHVRQEVTVAPVGGNSHTVSISLIPLGTILPPLHTDQMGAAQRYWWDVWVRVVEGGGGGCWEGGG